MRIAVISDMAPGSHKAYAINVAKTSGGLVRLGHDVTVFCRAPEEGWTVQAAGAAYGEPLLKWRAFPGERQADEHLSHKHYLQGISNWAAQAIAEGGFDAVYARHCWGAIRCAQLGIPTVVETHLDPIDDWLGGQTAVRMASANPTHGCDAMRGVVTISPQLAEKYFALGADPARTRIVPDAVDPAMFVPGDDLGPDLLGPRSKPRVLFAGNLYPLNGIPTMLECAARMPELEFHFVGGPESEVRSVASRAPANVVCHGPVPHRCVPACLWHADVLVLPLSAKHPARLWASPVKLGEYLASGRPVVCSDLPALRALVDAPAVRWFAPDDAASLAEGVRMAVAEPQPAGRASAVDRFVSEHTYERRASVITDLMGGNRAVAAA